MDHSNEIQETLGRNYNIPDDIDEEELLGELDALEADMARRRCRISSRPTASRVETVWSGFKTLNNLQHGTSTTIRM